MNAYPPHPFRFIPVIYSGTRSEQFFPPTVSENGFEDPSLHATPD